MRQEVIEDIASSTNTIKGCHSETEVKFNVSHPGFPLFDKIAKKTVPSKIEFLISPDAE